jgi:predicted DNA binding CopG/RHH family protein
MSPEELAVEWLASAIRKAIDNPEAMGLVSITLPQEDVKAIREKAAAAGMSYQTLIADIVHQYVTGKLVEKPRSA